MKRRSKSETGGSRAGAKEPNAGSEGVSEPVGVGSGQESGEVDAPLVAAALNGDLGAFDQLVRRYQRRAVAVSYRLVGDAHSAADIAQDAFVRAFKSLAQLQDHGRFGSWLMRIVCNLSLNYRRANPRLRFLGENVDSEGHDFLDSVVDRGPQEGRATSALEMGELERAAAKAIEALPDKQKMALVLFSLQGLPQKEVARIMDCSVELVKWNVFEARKALRKTLRDFIE